MCNNRNNYGKKKNVIMSYIYRAPGSSIEVFNDWMKEKIPKINQKCIFDVQKTDIRNIKNKLTNIIKACKKDYHKLQNDNKNNIKATWNILNSIIRKTS